jgi:hypothetical protein
MKCGEKWNGKGGWLWLFPVKFHGGDIAQF